MDQFINLRQIQWANTTQTLILIELNNQVERNIKMNNSKTPALLWLNITLNILFLYNLKSSFCFIEKGLKYHFRQFIENRELNVIFS